jgi:hypothetical protein
MTLRRYGPSLAVTICIFLLANWIDYERYRRLIPGYDYLIGYGLPFEFFVKGGTLDIEQRILWHAVAGNLIAILVLAALVGWASKLYRNGRNTG